jgi:hypothetical protein
METATLKRKYETAVIEPDEIEIEKPDVSDIYFFGELSRNPDREVRLAHDAYIKALTDARNILMNKPNSEQRAMAHKMVEDACQ